VKNFGVAATGTNAVCCRVLKTDKLVPSANACYTFRPLLAILRH